MATYDAYYTLPDGSGLRCSQYGNRDCGWRLVSLTLMVAAAALTIFNSIQVTELKGDLVRVHPVIEYEQAVSGVPARLDNDEAKLHELQKKMQDYDSILDGLPARLDKDEKALNKVSPLPLQVSSLQEDLTQVHAEIQKLWDQVGTKLEIVLALYRAVDDHRMQTDVTQNAKEMLAQQGGRTLKVRVSDSYFSDPATFHKKELVVQYKAAAAAPLQEVIAQEGETLVISS